MRSLRAIEAREEPARHGLSGPLIRPVFARDAAGAGRFVKVSLRGHKRIPRPRSDACAVWAARWAGHWGRWALGQESLT